MTALTTRNVEFTHSAYDGGPIHGVLGTGELRARLNPFVFLDHFDVETDDSWGFDWHPHSGVATVTYVLSSDLDHADTSGAGGRLGEGGVQWMAAGGGIWHQEYYQPRSEHRVNGLQLWIALPPELENGPVDYQHAQSEELPAIGDTRVLAGTYDGVSSPIQPPVDFTYLHVSLGEAERWEFTPPEHHDVAWIYTESGTVEIGGSVVPPYTLAVLEPTEGAIALSAHAGPSSFVAGTAPANDQPIVASRGSMHTNAAALRSGQQRIAELAETARMEPR